MLLLAYNVFAGVANQNAIPALFDAYGGGVEYTPRSTFLSADKKMGLFILVVYCTLV